MSQLVVLSAAPSGRVTQDTVAIVNRNKDARNSRNRTLESLLYSKTKTFYGKRAIKYRNRKVFRSVHEKIVVYGK